MSYPPDFSYFEQFTNFEKTTGTRRDFHLQRMKKLLEDFNNPHEGISFVHIAGSKGKGSTGAYIAALMADASGEAIGIYASPHVHDYRERIRSALPGMTDYRSGFFPDAAYQHNIDKIKQHLNNHSHPPPTTFELLTLLSFLLFRSQRVSWAVIEVGLGGRLDSTNVIHPRLAVITPLEIEHSHYLGTTISSIAREKAGIIKTAVPVLSQTQEQVAQQIIGSCAAEQGSACYFYDSFSTTKKLKQFRSMLTQDAAYLHSNACLAYAAFLLLQESVGPGEKTRFKLAPQQAAMSIAHTTLAGRFERRLISSPKRQGAPKEVLLDAAHTPASIHSFLSAVATRRRLQPDKSLTIIFSALEDKNCQAMLQQIIPACDNLIVTGCGNFKRCNMEDLSRLATRIIVATRIMEGTTATKPAFSLIADPATAFRHALDSDENDIIAICGSFYLLGEIYKTL